MDKAHTLRLSPPFVSFSVGLFSRFGFEDPLIGRLASAFFSVEIAKSGFAFPAASNDADNQRESLGPPSARNCRLSTGSGEGRERVLQSPVS